MKQKNQNLDFRQIFDSLSPQVLVNRGEFAQLLDTTEAGISQMLYRGELPPTAFPDKRKACWFAGVIRQWLDSKLNNQLLPQSISSCNPPKIRKSSVGRPRATVDKI